jgi:hypothetical protein
MKIGVQIQPQGTTMAEMRRAWEQADAMGVDSLWTWDHFYPLFGDPDAAHFEGYTLLAAMATRTEILSCSPTWPEPSITSLAVDSCWVSALAGLSVTTTNTATNLGQHPDGSSCSVKHFRSSLTASRN